MTPTATHDANPYANGFDPSTGGMIGMSDPYYPQQAHRQEHVTKQPVRRLASCAELFSCSTTSMRRRYLT